MSTFTVDDAVAAATEAVNGLTSKFGVTANAAEVQSIANAVAEWLSGQARAAAEADGQTEADKITTPGEAEQKLREP